MTEHIVDIEFSGNELQSWANYQCLKMWSHGDICICGPFDLSVAVSSPMPKRYLYREDAFGYPNDLRNWLTERNSNLRADFFIPTLG